MTSCIIIGGGIGGLTAALALLRAGIDARVYEQAPRLGEVGAGLTLSRGAQRCCESLGLGPRLREKSAPVKGFAFLHYQTGEVLAALPEPVESAGQDTHIYRADLHAILVDAVRAHGADRIVLNHKLAAVRPRAGGATAVFTNGETAQGDVLVGADGARSAVRADIFGEGPPVFTGKTAFRFMLPASQAHPHLLPGGNACLFVGPGRVFNRYLVSNGTLLNCAAFQRDSDWARDGWNCPADPADMLASFAGWHESVLALMRLAPPASLIKWGIFARPPRDHFVSGRVALLGDAAHPMQPFLGLGAAMAIEDAAILGRALAEIADTDAALAAYDRVRVPRANRVLTLSRQQGELFDGIDPRGFALREAPSHDVELSAFDPRAVALEA